MKFRTHGMILSLFLVLGFVFSFSIEASAHEYQGVSHDGVPGTAAAEVGVNDRSKMIEFLNHRVAHFRAIQDDESLDELERARQVTILARSFRVEGPFKNAEKKIYTIGVNARGFVSNHALYPHLLGTKVNPDADPENSVIETLKALIDGSGMDKVECADYQFGGEDRVACATKVLTQIGESTFIVGLHHAEGDKALRFPQCSDNFDLGTSAADVFQDQDQEKLELYVKDVIAATQKELRDVVTGVVIDFRIRGIDLTDLAYVAANPGVLKEFEDEVTARIYDSISCFSRGELKHENIYIFVMGTDEFATVLVNGNDPDLNGLDLQVNDSEQREGEESIAVLFRNRLTKETGKYEVGQTATVEYRWVDPARPETFNEGWFERMEVPGNAHKVSYIEVADTWELIQGNPRQDLLIFGSGIYPDDDEGGGCALSGADIPGGALLNLLLVASALFFVVPLARRARGVLGRFRK